MKTPFLVACVCAVAALNFSVQAQELSDIKALRDEGVELMLSHRFEQSMAKRAQGLKLAKKALAAREAQFGKNSPELIPFLKITGQLSFATSLEVALSYYRRALVIAEKAYGPEHAEVAECLDNIASPQGSNKEANLFRERAYAMRRKIFGDDHPETAKSYCHLGGQARLAKKDQLGRDYLNRALAIFEKSLTPADADNFMPVLDFLGMLLQMANEGNGAAAKAYQQRVAAVKTRISSTAPADDIVMLRAAAQNAQVQGTAASISANETLLAALVKKHGERAANLLQPLTQLASDYRATGQQGKAAAALERLVHLDLGNGDRDALPILGAMQAASEFYEFIGDYEKALPLRQKVTSLLPKFKQNAKTDALNLAAAQLDLAKDFAKLGKSADAAKYLELARHAPWPKSKGNMESLVDLRPLADLHFQSGRDKEATALYEELLAIFAKLGLSSFPDNVFICQRLGVLRHKAGDLKGAQRYFERARKTVRSDDNDRATRLVHLAGSEAWLAQEQGRTQAAADLAHEWDADYHSCLKRLFAFATERQRMAFKQDNDPFSLWATLGDADEMARATLRYKGIVLDSLIEESRMQGGGEAAELAQAKQELMQAEFARSTAPAGADAGKDPRPVLQAKVEKLQTQAATNANNVLTHRAVDVTVAEVRKVLPADAALVEIIRYRHHVGALHFEMRYGAVVLLPVEGARWVSLGSAQDIEKAYEQFGKALVGEDTAFAAASTRLREVVWDPVAKALPPGVRTVVLSPDGETNTVSFAALVDESDHFLAEKYEFRYVSSGRYLLSTATAGGGRDIALFANPQFKRGGMEPAKVLADAAQRAISRKVELEDLPGTRQEAEALAALAATQQWSCASYLGHEARESALMKLKSPALLHIATHGFYLPADSAEGAPGGALLPLPANPMLRSGLALAGAKDTFTAWTSGNTYPTADDGVVTAAEAGTLHLEHTLLVTLSACETGLGETRVGEGVFGLRRSFLQAGAQNLMVTLWPINDETTVQFMTDFYRAVLPTGAVSQAMTAVQKQALLLIRGELGLRRAVLDAGGFMLISKGKP